MQFAPRLALAAAIAILTATAACGSDSTGPGGEDTPILARHFDSLYVQAKAQSQSDTMFNFRAVALSDLELPAAFGAAPTTLTVTTASGTETWKGFAFEEVVTNNGTPTDSGRLVLAYREADAHTLVVTVFLKNGTTTGAALVTNDTVVVHANSNAGSSTLASTGAACPAVPSGLANPVITTAQQATCLSATFSAALTLGFPATAGVDPALTHISFPLTTFAGERFQDPAGTATIQRVSGFFQRALLAQ
jgi:hypothetical protein